MSRCQALGSLVHPEPIRGNPSLRDETRGSGLAEIESPTATWGRRNGQLHQLALSCTNLRLEIFHTKEIMKIVFESVEGERLNRRNLLPSLRILNRGIPGLYEHVS